MAVIRVKSPCGAVPDRERTPRRNAQSHPALEKPFGKALRDGCR